MQLKYKEVYEKCKAQINMDPEAHEIRAAKEAYKNITNVSVVVGTIGRHGVVRFLLHKMTIPRARHDGVTFSLLLVTAGLQEEVRGHQEQVDLDLGQTRLPQRC